MAAFLFCHSCSFSFFLLSTSKLRQNQNCPIPCEQLSVCVKPAAVVDVTNFNCQVQWIEKDGKKIFEKNRSKIFHEEYPLSRYVVCFRAFLQNREKEFFSNIVKVFAVPLHLKIQQPNKKCSLKKLWKFCFEFFGTGKKRRIHDTFFSKLIFSF